MPNVWILAARPKTLWAGVTPIMIAVSLAWYDGNFHALSAFMALLGALLIQIGTNFANDYFDFVKGTDTAERVGPTRATQAGLVTPQQMKRAMVAAFALAFFVGLYLVYRGSWPILLIGLFSILFGVLYTGGPYPLGYLGLGDIFVLVFFGPVAVAGTYYVQALSVSPESVIAGLAPGFFSSAILTVNNLRDADGDAKTGKRTLAVRFGKTFARYEYLTTIIAGALIVPIALCLHTGAHYWALLSCLSFIPAIPAIKAVFTQEGAALNAILATTGKILLLFSLLFSVGWLL